VVAISLLASAKLKTKTGGLRELCGKKNRKFPENSRKNPKIPHFSLTFYDFL